MLLCSYMYIVMVHLLPTCENLMVKMWVFHSKQQSRLTWSTSLSTVSKKKRKEQAIMCCATRTTVPIFLSHVSSWVHKGYTSASIFLHIYVVNLSTLISEIYTPYSSVGKCHKVAYSSNIFLQHIKKSSKHDHHFFFSCGCWNRSHSFLLRW